MEQRNEQLKKQSESLLADAVHPLLKAAGFQRRGSAWLRPVQDELVQILSVDNCKYNSANERRFRFQIGFYLADWADHMYGGKRRPPEEVRSILREHVPDLEGAAVDAFYHILRYSDLRALAQTLAAVIANVVIPHFDRIRDIRALARHIVRNYDGFYSVVAAGPYALPFLLMRQGNMQAARRAVSCRLSEDPARQQRELELAGRLGIDVAGLSRAAPPLGVLLNRWRGRLFARVKRWNQRRRATLEYQRLRLLLDKLLEETAREYLGPLGFVFSDSTVRRDVKEVQQILEFNTQGGGWNRAVPFRVNPAFFDADFFRLYWPDRKVPARPHSTDCFLDLHALRPPDCLSPETDLAALRADLSRFLESEVVPLFKTVDSRPALARYATGRKIEHKGGTDHLGLPLYLALAGESDLARKAFEATAKSANSTQRAVLRQHARAVNLKVRI